MSRVSFGVKLERDLTVENHAEQAGQKIKGFKTRN